MPDRPLLDRAGAAGRTSTVRAELLRWTGSIGIFYVLIPIFLLASERWLRAALPVQPPPIDAAALQVAFALAGALGAWLVIASIRAQLVRGGHPFDLTGRESFSKPTPSLLATGVYGLSRNPMGLGDVLLYACLTGLAQCTWTLLLQVPAYALLVVWNHRVNERPALLRRFGATYEDYERRTPLLIPGPRAIWNWRRASEPPPQP